MENVDSAVDEQEKQGFSPIVVWGSVLTIVVVVVLVLFPLETPTQISDVTGSWLPTIGERVALNGGATNTVHACASLAAFEQYVKYARAKDVIGIAELIVGKQVFSLANGTAGLVLSKGDHAGYNYVELRVLNMELGSPVGYVLASQVSKSGATTQ